MKKTKKKSVKGKRPRARAVKDLTVSDVRQVKGGARIEYKPQNTKDGSLGAGPTVLK